MGRPPRFMVDPYMTYIPAGRILGLISFVSAIMQEDIDCGTDPTMWLL